MQKIAKTVSFDIESTKLGYFLTFKDPSTTHCEQLTRCGAPQAAHAPSMWKKARPSQTQKLQAFASKSWRVLSEMSENV